MGDVSQAILGLKPVTFYYKKEIDPKGTLQFGLVAEDVETVNSDLVVHDKEEKSHSVRYDQVNAMLLNEFLKEHEKVQQQKASIAQLKTTLARQEVTIAQQQKRFDQQEVQIQAITCDLKKVSAKIEVRKPAAQMVLIQP